MSLQKQNFLFGYPIDLYGYTDPISNTVVIIDTKATKLIREIGSNPLPVDYLGIFLHEATHHTCFFTPVGRSLAALAVSAAGETSPAVMTDETVRMRQNDIIKHYCFREFLLPLEEGLAMFAQFDACPKDSLLISEPIRKTFYVFAPEKMTDLVASGWSDNILEDFKKFLLDNRLKRQWVESKAHLLSLGLSQKRGYYLLGYLFVKSLQLQLIPKCPRFRDSDLFLSFMISYWFSDALFAELLIRDTCDVGKDIQRVFSYFQHRIEGLMKNVIRFVAEFEWLLTKADYMEMENLKWPTYCNRDSVDTTMLLMQQELRVVGKYGPLNWDFLGNRPVFRFAAMEAEVEVRPNGEVIVRDKKTRISVIHGKALFNISEPYIKPGSIEAVLLPDARIIICIFDDKELVATITMPDRTWNEKSLLGLSDTMLPYKRVYDFLCEIEKQRQFFSAGFKNRLDDLNRDARDAAYKIYVSVGLKDLNGKCDFHKVCLLRKAGFSAIFGKDKKLLDFASKMSLLAGHGFQFGELVSLLNLPEDVIRANYRRLESKFLSKLNLRPFLFAVDRLLGSLL